MNGSQKTSVPRPNLHRQRQKCRGEDEKEQFANDCELFINEQSSSHESHSFNLRIHTLATDRCRRVSVPVQREFLHESVHSELASASVETAAEVFALLLVPPYDSVLVAVLHWMVEVMNLSVVYSLMPSLD